MLSLFIIGLRETLEAALVIIIAIGILKKYNRKDLFKYVGFSTLASIILSCIIAYIIYITVRELNEYYEELFNFFINAFSISMVTIMIIWIKRNADQLHLKNKIKDSITKNKLSILLSTIFLSVLKEGVELVSLSSVILIHQNTYSFYLSLLIGVLSAVLIAYCIYSTIFKINLRIFFLITNSYLLLFAAGILIRTLHTAIKAGFINDIYDKTLINLSNYLSNDNVITALLSSIFGFHPIIKVTDFIIWILYIIVMLIILNKVSTVKQKQ